MARAIRVLCVTPSGIDGRGGIDRLYYYLRQDCAPDSMEGVDLRFAAARGAAAGALWPFAFPGRLLAVARAIRAFAPDIVHVNFANRGSAWRKLAIIRLARASGAKIVAHLHDDLPREALARRAIAGRLFRAICASADRVVALGRPAAAELAALGVPAAKIRVVLNGIPDFAGAAAPPRTQGGAVSILFAGHVGARKGADILLRALGILAERGIGGWSCVVAGDGEVEAHAAMAAAGGLSDKVRFTGWIDAGAIHALMRATDIVALPSKSEALPLSLIEGACAGAALVATGVANIPEVVIDGETGLIVDRDPEAVADALAALIADRGALARMQAAARRRYEDALTLERFAASLRALYEELGAE